ncbi:MAG: hypothetical protein O7E52_08555 [Candidatus Poribacteria bacterium]|nr:hypothetical protein [Candidatus Poribacteria bacterium]
MPFCPQCKTEYTEGILMCADCQVELVPERPPEETFEYVDWEVVQEVPSEFVGNMIQGVLEGEGIDTVVRPYEIGALGGVRLEPEWGEVLVRHDDLQNAKAIVDEYLANLPTNAIENQETDLEEV